MNDIVNYGDHGVREGASSVGMEWFGTGKVVYVRSRSWRGSDITYFRD